MESIKEFKRRQGLYRAAERKATLEAARAAEKSNSSKAQAAQMIIDATGSLCEVLRFDKQNQPDMQDPINQMIEKHMVILNLDVNAAGERKIIKRALADPKPMLYNEEMLDAWLAEWLDDEASYAGFVEWVFPRLIALRRSLNGALGSRFGATLPARKFWQMVEKEGAALPVVQEAVAKQKQR